MTWFRFWVLIKVKDLLLNQKKMTKFLLWLTYWLGTYKQLWIGQSVKISIFEDADHIKSNFKIICFWKNLFF